MSLLLPGLGQLYNRQVRLALALTIVALLWSIPGRWLIAAVPADAVVHVYAIVLLVGLPNLLFAIVQAAIGARRAKAVALAWFNRWYVYIGLVVLVTMLRVLGLFAPISSITAYSSPSGSMIPTLMVGDRFEARTKAFAGRLPERGEIAIFRPPSEPETDFVKRIIGLPGDRIQLREGRLYLNDVMVERVALSDAEATPLLQDYASDRVYRETLPGGASYLISEISDNEGLDNTPKFVVPADHVFVLGDNRDRSNDSRTGLGFIPLSGLRDKPLFLFWSGDWSRIGKVPE
ncbi:MAG TPA: signal peptidase I [Dongiaceae bacterium]